LSQTNVNGVRRRTDNWQLALSGFFHGITDSTMTAILACTAPPTVNWHVLHHPQCTGMYCTTHSVVKIHHVLFTQYIDALRFVLPTNSDY